MRDYYKLIDCTYDHTFLVTMRAASRGVYLTGVRAVSRGVCWTDEISTVFFKFTFGVRMLGLQWTIKFKEHRSTTFLPAKL